MSKRNKLTVLLVILLTAALLLTSCTASALETAKKKKNRTTPTVTVAVTATPAAAPTASPTAVPAPTATPGPMEEAQRIADYIFENGKLPNNFITKREARTLGWDSSWNYVSDVAPGMSIGGDYFGNYEKQLPVVENRLYYEADCFYHGGKRNQYRIIYSNDCHVWFTGDHYQTFIELFPSKEESE